MKIPGKLQWDPDAELFIDNDEANAMLDREQRNPYGTNYVKV
jgi:hypothetical protein